MKSILVTTLHRGVFYGEVPAEQDMNARTISLKNARCAIRWETTGGIGELASVGPNANSKIGACADIEALHDITAIWSVSDEARKAWNA